MINDEDGRRRANTIIYLMLALGTLNLVQINSRLQRAQASKQTPIQETQTQPEGAIALEKRLYNRYRPLVFGDLERGIKPLADLNGDGRIDEQEKALVYKLAGVDEEQIIRFGKDVYYPVLTGYKMQGVWQKLSDRKVDKVINQTKQRR